MPLKPSSRAYDVWVGPGALERASRLQPLKKAVILSDQSLSAARAALRQTLTNGGVEVAEIPVTAGESLKDFKTLYPLYGELLRAGADRDSVLFALGGGSIGDAAGFIAATYLRGIRWVGVPTTLLAQVDSSVGGKTGINHPLGKNLIGAFHQPALVLCDTDLLKSLSTREVVSGIGETIKYGLIYDPSFCAFIQKNLKALLTLDPTVLAPVVARSLRWKAQAVALDEFDRLGIREALNFGHTFGHALESITQYGLFQHGEAVIWGMRFALALSERHGMLKTADRAPLERLLAGLPVPPLPSSPVASELFNELLAKMRKDKKIRDGKIHFVLLKKPGKTVTSSDITERELAEAYRLITCS